LRTYFDFHFYTDWDEFKLSVYLLEVRHSYWFREDDELVEEVESGLNDFKGLLSLDVIYPRNGPKTQFHINSALWAAGGERCLQSLDKHFRSGVLRGDRKVILRVSIMSRVDRHSRQV